MAISFIFGVDFQNARRIESLSKHVRLGVKGSDHDVF